ncbi:FHA domain-containing protein [Mycolicibacterium septicum]|nr:FHA domain-containing protein [Mycolicibacterium septicum]
MNSIDRLHVPEEASLHTAAVHRDPNSSSAAPVPHTLSAGPGTSPGSGALVITRGPSVGGRFLLTNPVTFAGRHPDSPVFLDDITVSRRHAEFRWSDDEYWIVDSGSLNGIYVNQVPVQSQPLSNGDEIQIGKFRLTFTCRPEAEPLP